MTTLAVMRPAFYPGYMAASVAHYAEDNIASGRWPAQGAHARSRSEWDSLLPQGLATPNNHLFEIEATAQGPTIGALWIAIEERHGQRSAFVFDVGIDPPWRRQGHALRTFEALESLARELGASHIGLHVFGRNAGAQALYAKLGYAVTGINLQKRLTPPAG